MKSVLRSLAIIAALVLLAPPVAAQSPAEPASQTLHEWIIRDQTIGRLPDSPERNAAGAALQQDMIAALQAARVAVEADVAAGRTSDTCLPPRGSAQVSSDEIGKFLYSRPASEYGESLVQVMVRFLAHRFACR